MCTMWLIPEPCMNFKCPHNLFWEKLRLDKEKIRITDKAVKIRNCCCLLTKPWTPVEISDAWGLPSEGISQSEEVARLKLLKKIRINGNALQVVNNVRRRVKHKKLSSELELQSRFLP